MGILPSKESHEYPGAFHFAQSGCHAMAILPLTEHFFPSVDSLAFRQLYACRDMQSAKYNFSLVSPQIIAKYRERAMEQLRAKAANGGEAVTPPKDLWKPRPFLARKPGADSPAHPQEHHGEDGDDNGSDASVADQDIDADKARTTWVEVDDINAGNFGQFYGNDTRCISPDESEWPFPHHEEELCGELQHPNPSAHWRTHDAARQYLQMENQELGLRTTPYSAARSVAEGQNYRSSSNAGPPSQQQQGEGTPSSPSPPSYQHPRNISFDFDITPEAAAEFADHERAYVDKFFSRSPEALYSALVVEPNRGFLVDTNKEMCEIYAAETRWKEARQVVRAYRHQCKEEKEEGKGKDKAAKAAAAHDSGNRKDTAKSASAASQRRVTKEEAEEAAKVPPPRIFLRPAPQVIVVRIHRDEEEATRAKYLAEQQRKQRRHAAGANFDDETMSAGSRSPVSGSVSPLLNTLTQQSPTPSSASHLLEPTGRKHRFEEDDRYKDGRIHLVEEDGVLYIFAYNTAYVDPRQKAKERRQRRDEQARRKPTDPAGQHTTPSSSAAGDDDEGEEPDATTGGMRGGGSRQTSSFYHIVDAFGSEDPENATVEGSKRSAAADRSIKKSTTVAAAATAGAKGNSEEEDDDDDTALCPQGGGGGGGPRERQQETVVFVDEAETHRPQNRPESATDDDDESEDDDEAGAPSARDRRGQRERQARQTSTSAGSESTAATSPTERPREVNQLQLFTASPFILPICPVRVVGCNGYTESSCRGTPWLRGTDDDPEEDAYVESLPVRPPVMSGGGFIDANIGDKILSRAFLLGFQVFRNVCLDAGLPETLTRPFWTLGLLSNIPLLQISREMRFRMRAAAAEVQLGFQGLRDMIKGTENDLQSYIYGFSDILPYLERASQARLLQAAAEEEAEAARAAAAEDSNDGEEEEDGEKTRPGGGSGSPSSLHPLLLPDNNEPYTLPTRASQPVAQRSLRFPRRPIEFYTQLTIRGNQCLSRVRTESQRSFFHLIAEATAPVSTSLFMKPLELHMYDYGGAVRLHLLRSQETATGDAMQQVLPPPKNVDQLIRDHQRRVQLRHLAKQTNNNSGSADGTTKTTTTATTTAGLGKGTEEEGGSPNARPGGHKFAKEHEDTAAPPYLVYTIVQPSAWAAGPSLKHYRRIMHGPDGQSIDEADHPATVDLTDVELLSMCDPAAADGAATTVTRCTCCGEDGAGPQPVFAPHQYLYEDGLFVDGDMVVYNVHAGRWEHFEYFHRQQLARRRAQRALQKQMKLHNSNSNSEDAKEAPPQQQQQQQAGGAQKGPSTTTTTAAAPAAVVSVPGVTVAGKVVADELSDEDEEDIHQEDILLCWIKRRLQSATTRNRQDPGWLRDSDGHIVQEGRYYIWGFEHDDQRYFYGLIPKFAKEKKTKRHSNDKMPHTHSGTAAVSGHRRRHGGGSSIGTSSATPLSPSMSTVSAHELRRLTAGGRHNSYANGGNSSGRNRNNNSPGARSARSSQSQSQSLTTCTPQNQHLRHSGGGVGGAGGNANMGGDELGGNDFGENSCSGCHVQTYAPLVLSMPDSQAQCSQGGSSNMSSPGSSRRALRAGDGNGGRSPTNAAVAGGGMASTAAVATATGTTPTTTAAASISNSSNTSSAVRQGRAGPKQPSKVSAFLAVAAASAVKESEGFSSTLAVGTAGPGQGATAATTRGGGGGGGHAFPPRVVSAPLQSTASKSTGAGAAAAAAAADASFHSPSSSSSDGTRVWGGRQPVVVPVSHQDMSSLPPPPAAQQRMPQHQQLDYAPASGNAMMSGNRRGRAMLAGGSRPQQQQQQQNQQYPPQRGGPSMNFASNSNENEWYASRDSAGDQSPPPPPPPPPIAGGNFDGARGYMNPPPSQQQQQQQQPQQHLHPPTAYMNTNTVNIHRTSQLPQSRRVQQQQQQGPLPQMGPQGYPPYNPQAQRQQQQQQQQQPSPYGLQPQMNMMSGPGPRGESVSPLPPQQQSMPSMTDVPPPPPPPMSMNARPHTNNSNSNMMGGGVSAGVQGVYADPSAHSTPNPSFHSSYYPDVSLPPPPLQQQQQQQQMPPPPPPPSSQRPAHGSGGSSSSFYSAPPQPMARHAVQHTQQQQTSQPAYNAGPNGGHLTGAMYVDAGMASSAGPQQKQQQQQMRTSPAMPPPPSTRSGSASVMAGPPPPPPMGGPANPSYPPRQPLGNLGTSTAIAATTPSPNAYGNPNVPPGHRGGGDAGMYDNSSNSNSNVGGFPGAPSPSSPPNNAAGGGWGSPPLPMSYNSNNGGSSSSNAPTPNPAIQSSSARPSGPVGSRGPHPVPPGNPYPSQAPMNAGGTGRSGSGNNNNAYPAWGPVSNTASNRASSMQQHQQLPGPYPTPTREAGYGHDAYNAAGGVHHSNSSNTNNPNPRTMSSPYPQQYPQQQQMNSPPSHNSSYAPTPLPPPQLQQQQQQQHGGSAGNAGMTGTSNAYGHPSAPPPPPPPSQPQVPYPAPLSNPPHHTPAHGNNPYSKSVTASPALSYAPQEQPSSPPQPPQQQHLPPPPPPHVASSNSNNPYRYGASTSSQLPQDAVATRTGSNVSVQQQQQQQSQHRLATPTGSSSTFSRDASGGGGPSGIYPPMSGPANGPRQQQQQHSVPPSPAPNSSYFPSGPQQQQQQQQQQVASANASGTLLRSSPGPQQRQHLLFPPQRHTPQQRQQGSGSPTLSYNTQQSPTSPPPQQQHLSPHFGSETAMQLQLQRSGDSYEEGRSPEMSSSSGLLSRFSHNPYVMQ
ncbi:P299 protein [Leptomonas pyrrhocoris]|uniref:p299 protein n=1 Tax=Leptomonas pyrrhocoris TaxID=157538 RepID=A0A0N0DRN0_LEPPY|nr:P299 protein [Leptomonas pyrrhocoris]KPA74698.1 P299 protein [Leptomonas pyrrhocoris]|eukprot:XP_015653137.1 P299 protein [Leptomonas pyrrhocoris]